jgi:nitrogen fixation NifU-like protein
MIKGKSLDEAVKLSNKAVADALGGLPAREKHGRTWRRTLFERR